MGTRCGGHAWTERYYFRESGGREMFEEALGGCHEARPRRYFWPVYPAKGSGCKVSARRLGARLGRAREGEWARVGCTHGGREEGANGVWATYSAATRRYRAGRQYATDVGGQRGRRWMRCGMRTDLSICVDSQRPGWYGRRLLCAESPPRLLPASVTARSRLGRGGRSLTAVPLAPRFQRLTSAGLHRCTRP